MLKDLWWEKIDRHEKRENHSQICRHCQPRKNYRERKKVKTKKTDGPNRMKRMGMTRIINIKLKRGNPTNKRN